MFLDYVIFVCFLSYLFMVFGFFWAIFILFFRGGAKSWLSHHPYGTPAWTQSDDIGMMIVAAAAAADAAVVTGSWTQASLDGLCDVGCPCPEYLAI